MAEENVPQEETTEILVTPEQAFQIKLQEFDKLITQAEAQAANLKAQRAAFILDTNMEQLKASSKAKEEKK